MICQRCLHRGTVLPLRQLIFFRPLTTTPQAPSPASAPASTSSPAQPFTTPPSSANAQPPRPKAKAAPLPVSAAPAGTLLKGLNFLKGREDPLALPESEYPEWLWRILDSSKGSGVDGAAADDLGDEFSKSKTQRRMAAKRQRKLEARLIASGDTEALAPKVPLQRQTIDLKSNEEGSAAGALEAVVERDALTKAMRGERRAKIKERNFLKGMR